MSKYGLADVESLRFNVNFEGKQAWVRKPLCYSFLFTESAIARSEEGVDYVQLLSCQFNPFRPQHFVKVIYTSPSDNSFKLGVANTKGNVTNFITKPEFVCEILDSISICITDQLLTLKCCSKDGSSKWTYSIEHNHGSFCPLWKVKFPYIVTKEKTSGRNFIMIGSKSMFSYVG